MTELPWISIGIATYNNASTLKRAIESALAQHPGVEVIITDNASTDETPAVCAHYVAQDPRVRCFRHASNVSDTVNFRTALQLATGRYFMWLGDEDWLEPEYVLACTDVLDRSKKHSLVSGIARYFQPGTSIPLREDRVMVLEQSAPEERVLSYFALARENGVFYGVSRREQVLRIGLGSDFGADWALVASLAFLGNVRTLQGVYLNRTSASSSPLPTDRALHGSTGDSLRTEDHNPMLAWKMYAEISHNAEAFKPLGVVRRQRLGLLVADTLLVSRYGTKTFLVRSRIAARRRVTNVIGHVKSAIRI